MKRYYLPLLALLGCAGIAYATGSITVTGYPPVPRTIKGGAGINIGADGTVTATGEAVSIGSQPFQNISTALHGKFLPLAGTAVNSTDAQAYKGNSAPSATEFSYIQGVTSSIQTQLTGKANSNALSTVATTGSYTDLANKPTIPTALSELSGDSTHQVVTDAEKASWNGKQAALGFTPENAANKGAINGYPSLDSGGKIPAAQVPTLNQNTTGTAAGLTAAYIDWSLSSGGASIKNKPNLSTVATSGNYSDLSGKPAPYTLPTASTIVKGGVMVDGSSIQIDGAGVIHSTVSAGVSEVNGQTGAVSLDINDIVGFDGYSTAVNNKFAQKLNVSDAYVLPAATDSTLGGVKVGTTMGISGGILDYIGPTGLVTIDLVAGAQVVDSGRAWTATAAGWIATFNSYTSPKQTTFDTGAFGNYSGAICAAAGGKLYWKNPVTFANNSSVCAKVRPGTDVAAKHTGGRTLLRSNQNLQRINTPPTATITVTNVTP